MLCGLCVTWAAAAELLGPELGWACAEPSGYTAVPGCPQGSGG